MYEYCNPSSGAAIFLLFCIFIFSVIMYVKSIAEPTRSRKYANMLSDMYVIGTIKKLSDKDGIDLVKELREFQRIDKKSKLSEKGLVYVIEGELKEKVADVQEKSLEK